MTQSIDTALARALADEKQAAAIRMGLVRLIAVGGYVLVLLVLGVVLDDPLWKSGLVPAFAYFAFALAVYAYRRWPNAPKTWLPFVIPLVDTPIATWTLWGAAQTGSASGVAAFGAVVFALLILLVSSSLERRLIALEAVVACACEALLLWLVGASFGSIFVSCVVLGAIAYGCAYLVRRLGVLLERTVAEQLQRERLERYFSPAVSQELQRVDLAPGGQTREVTVLFSDVRGFTAMCESNEGAVVVDFLNVYLTRMVDVIFAHGGTLDKFMGDGILAYFGAPIEQFDHAQRAVQCAIAMRHEVEAMAASATVPPWLGLRSGIGIHSGTAIIGDIGSPRRREYTIVGDAVNLASRVEGLTKELGHPILVSESTRAALSQDIEVLALDAVTVRGKRAPVHVFAVLGVRSNA